MTSPRLALLAAVAVSTLGLAACSSSGSSAPSPTPSGSGSSHTSAAPSVSTVPPVNTASVPKLTFAHVGAKTAKKLELGLVQLGGVASVNYAGSTKTLTVFVKNATAHQRAAITHAVAKARKG